METSSLKIPLKAKQETRRHKITEYLREHPEYELRKKNKYKYTIQHLDLTRRIMENTFKKITPDIIGTDEHERLLLIYEKALRIEKYILKRLQPVISNEVRKKLKKATIPEWTKRYLRGEVNFM